MAQEVNVIVYTCSPRLPDILLRGSPSLLWQAANSGDEEAFRLLLERLRSFEEVGRPEPAPSGTTIIQTALIKGHDKVLKLALNYDKHPGLFPRYLMLISGLDNYINDFLNFFCREEVMTSAIRFKRWDFLASNFTDKNEMIKWQKIRETGKRKFAALKRLRKSMKKKTKIYGLSCHFPMYNDDACPAPESNAVKTESESMK